MASDEWRKQLNPDSAVRRLARAVWSPAEYWFKTFKPFNRSAPFKPSLATLFPRQRVGDEEAG